MVRLFTPAVAFALTFTLGACAQLHAAESKIKFNYKAAELTHVVEDYAKASGQKFILSPEAHGKITIINGEPISLAEAFNQFSSALATNGLAISKQDQVMLISSARNIQRNLLDVGSTLPPLRPERMFVWTVTLKYANASSLNNELRILSSKDGELVPITRTNQIIITDWVSNLYRVEKILKEIDVPAGEKKVGS